jgi:hypothetical protein
MAPVMRTPSANGPPSEPHTRELKSIFGRTAGETPVTREEFQLIRDSGAPGMAVVEAE